MNSSSLKHAIRLGEIKVGTKKYSNNKHIHWNYALVVDYDDKFPKNLKNKCLSIVYFILVNDEICKIGQTSGISGIQGCLSFYSKAGLDDPGENRFLISYLMRECISQGKKIEVYMQYAEPIKVKTKGIFNDEIVEVPVSAKGMEGVCISDYQSVYGKNSYPIWNFQEANESPPKHILLEYQDYTSKRKQQREK
jgi:hypothetical protein